MRYIAVSLVDDRLDSWKDIAAYLKRDVSTVQRWEKREGMPVHRHLHGKLGSVYAFPAELDEWWRGRHGAPESFPAPSAPRRPPAWMIAAVIVAIALGGALVWYVARSGYFWRNPIANARFVRLTDFEGTEEAAAISRDGKFVAFLADRDGPVDVWVTQPGSGEFHNLTHGKLRELVNPDVRTIGFSPDAAFVTMWVRKQSAGGGPAAISVWSIPTLGGDPAYARSARRPSAMWASVARVWSRVATAVARFARTSASARCRSGAAAAGAGSGSVSTTRSRSVPSVATPCQSPATISSRTRSVTSPGERAEMGRGERPANTAPEREAPAHLAVTTCACDPATFKARDQVGHLDGDLVQLPLLVATRHPGDRMRPLGQKSAKRLQDILVDAHVPRHLRDSLPVVWDREEIVWIPGVTVAESKRVTSATRHQLHLEIERS